METLSVSSELQASSSQQQKDDGNDDPNRKKPNAKKRTKTGCLTCRKRRIKCDEGRPTCNNCIKSKRQCEGYNQRVIFREPIGSLHPFGPAVYPPGASHPVDGPFAAQHGRQPRGPLQAIAPRPPAPNFHRHHGLPPHNEPVSHQPHFPHQAQIPENATAYGLNQGQFLRPEAYSQLPNPLLAQEIMPSSVQSNPGSNFPYFGSGDDNARQGLSNPNRIFAAFPNTLPSEFSQPRGDAQLLGGRLEHGLPDDDVSLSDSDDDLPDAQDLVPVVNMHSRAWDRNATEVRTFSAFAQNSAVVAYMDSPYSLEFWNSGLRAILMHFINVTGPSISLYERYPFNPSDQGSFGAEPGSGRSLWGHTFPLLALQNQALQHAMLALASLQLAKLQDSPETAALKHYHKSLRRIANYVKSELPIDQTSNQSAKRPEGQTASNPTAITTKLVATIAATLLLSYFEVWSSDHTKWCSHLFGARILFRGIRLRDMTLLCLPAKRMRQQQMYQNRNRHMGSYFPGLNTSVRTQMDTEALNYDLLGAITGFTIAPEDYGEGEGQIPDDRVFSTTDKDIETYDTLVDLFWWYCKMDVYQSILGGTKLFMEYECWTQCPPRTAISKVGAVCGTYDHLILLLGRLADFSSMDLSRKRKAAKSQGGNMGGGSPPMFAGMLPAQATIHAPMGFGSRRDASPQSDANEDPDPDGSYEAALQEWNGILEAFEIFKNHLGPEFKPLGMEYADRRESPFGDAVQFRTFSIAGIWMNYYMGLIHLHRSHPSMPPTAMRAAGLTAHKTADYAIEIGRIAAGLSDDCSRFTEIDTYLGAAFIESCFCLFVAAVQFQDTAQRNWVVQRLHDVARLTGWQSARQIADGCESAWIKGAQMGGPPYMRPPTINNVPLSIWQNPRRIVQRIRQEQGESSQENRIVLAKAERAHYALGLLGVEDDLERLELRDEIHVPKPN